MKTKYILTAIGILLILVGVMGIGIYYNLQKFGDKPIHSLRAAHDAIENRDLATFKKYVDTDAIIEIAAREILTVQINSEIMPTAYSMDELQTRYENQLKPDFMKSARAALDEYVLTGKATFPDNLTDAQKFLSKSCVTSCEIKDFSKPRAVGKSMVSSVIFYNTQMKFSFELELELTPAAEINWRVTGATGF